MFVQDVFFFHEHPLVDIHIPRNALWDTCADVCPGERSTSGPVPSSFHLT